MILDALREFLLGDVRRLDNVREQGRKTFKDIVGTNIFDGRLPRCSANVAVVLSQISDDPERAVGSPAGFTLYVVELEFSARDSATMSGSKAARRAEQALRQWITQYRGRLNADVTAQGIWYESGPSETPAPATDASGNWKFRYSTTYSIGATVLLPTGAN